MFSFLLILQGQRSPEDSPRRLGGSKQTSRRASEDNSRPGSRMYSPQTSKRNSLDEGPSIPAIARVKEQETLPLTPVEDSEMLLSDPQDNEGLSVLEKQGEEAIKLLEAEEAMEHLKISKNDSKLTSFPIKEDTPDKERPPEIPVKKKMSKAERRALQEAQRAAKAAKTAPKAQNKAPVKESVEKSGPVSSTMETREIPEPASFFDHLPRQGHFSMEELANIAAEKSIPVACISLGAQMLEGSIRGTNNRSLAFLQMIDTAISSFELSEGQSFTREFTIAVKNMVSFLVRCRTLSPAVGNVVKSIKAELGRLAQTNLSNQEARNEFHRFIATFSQDKITMAQQALAGTAAEKINNGDIILTYSRSTTVEQTLKQAASSGKKFSVVIADGSPLFEGKGLLTELLRVGIPCEYMLLNSLETGMNLANKVMLGAAAVMSNGAVLSRAGTAAVAMSATLAHVPVIICSETYKFHERIQLDSITNNELADPAGLLQNVRTQDVKDGIAKGSNLSLLNIVYDTTPADFITVIITEVGALPPTSVPVVLREYRSETELLMHSN